MCQYFQNCSESLTDIHQWWSSDCPEFQFLSGFSHFWNNLAHFEPLPFKDSVSKGLIVRGPWVSPSKFECRRSAGWNSLRMSKGLAKSDTVGLSVHRGASKGLDTWKHLENGSLGRTSCIPLLSDPLERIMHVILISYPITQNLPKKIIYIWFLTIVKKTLATSWIVFIG